MKLVLVEWVDSHSGRGWRTLDELKDECRPLVCRSVGWLVKRANRQVLLVASLNSENEKDLLTNGCSDTVIPTSCITRMVELRESS